MSVAPLSGIVKRAWIPLVLLVVLAVSGLVVSRLHRQFASQNLNANAGAGIEIVQFKPKIMIYDAYGSGTAQISYFGSTLTSAAEGSILYLTQGRRRLAGDDRFETQIVVMASDSDAVSWLRLGGRFVFDTHCVRGRTGSLCVRVQYELADAGQTYGVNVAVTSVDACNVKFDIQGRRPTKALI